MSGFGSVMRVALALLCYAVFYLPYCGGRAISRCALFCWRSASRPSSSCRCTIRRPSFLQLCARALLLGIVLTAATRLSLAEWHYAQAWPPATIEAAMPELEKARSLYPLLRRFRDGPALRLKLYAERGV